MAKQQQKRTKPSHVPQVRINPDQLPEPVRSQLEGVPEEQQGPFLVHLMATSYEVQQKFFSGPLPSPETLAEYEAAFPGSGERIIRMAEAKIEMAQSQSEHRRDLEKTVVKRSLNQSSTGQWMAFTIGIITIVGSLGLIYMGHDWAGVGLIGGLATVLAPFLLNKVNKDAEKGTEIDT
ncbi:Uncharacterized membrane protein [Catalinimonas alkaloidigena]|uniref:Uncharacterized membrane protein n=1 Tax=Catalinimonas alkaloidigena TaxID=1075417 RepID=A0A1G9E6W3_9BACT|nr:DUF2335 domain-containing protein [Catalinimonas alkaloidigena]SDK71853.1 Uncharacterized membrane protein [Catalinimonas alkaloidigena]